MAEIGHKEATPYSPEGEKEDPYDFEEKRTKNANGARVFGIALIIAGLITSASSFPILIGMFSCCRILCDETVLRSWLAV